MPFDPTQPTPNAPNSSQVMRDQLNALKALVDAGVPGPPGPPGAEGANGEVLFSDLMAERINHAANPTAVATLALVVSDPPTQGQVQAVADKMDELIAALRRNPV